jgi:hypothetical protein
MRSHNLSITKSVADLFGSRAGSRRTTTSTAPQPGIYGKSKDEAFTMPSTKTPGGGGDLTARKATAFWSVTLYDGRPAPQQQWTATIGSRQRG